MKKYYLRPNVTEQMLLENGFTLMDTPVGRAAIYTEDKEIDSLIVILNPPIRELKNRYQNNSSNIENVIKPLKKLLEERNV